MAEQENNNINEFDENAQQDVEIGQNEEISDEALDNSVSEEQTAADENNIEEPLNTLNAEDGQTVSDKVDETASEAAEESSTNELLKELAKEDASYLAQGDVKVKKPVKKSVIAVIVSAVIVIAAVVAGLIIWANPSQGGKSGNTLGNLANYGYAVSDGEWTYFTALSDQSAGEDAAAATSSDDSTDTTSSSATISIFMTNGQEEKTLVEEGGTYLNVSGNYVYYLGYSDGYIYRVKKDGTNISQFNSVQCSALQVKGSYIYYVSASDGGVYTMRTDGGKTTKISPDGLQVYQIAVDDDGIYYISQTDTLLYKADFNFSNPVAISDQTQATRFTIEGDSIYYTVVNENYSESTDDDSSASDSSDTSSDAVSSDSASSDTTSSNTDSSDTSSGSDSDSSGEPEIITYKADKDGSNAKAILEDALCPIVVDDYIFYSDFEGYICRADLNGENSKQLEHKGQLFNRGGDLLYYIFADSDSDDYGYVYKINIDGTDPRKV